MTGFWFVEEPSSFVPPAGLARFLDEGPPPVAVGFGSMSTEEPEEVSALVLEAAREVRVRLVLLSGWACLKPGLLRGRAAEIGRLIRAEQGAACAAAAIAQGGKG